MSTRRALLFSFLDRYSSLLLSIASSMVIARLLTPAEIGIFSVTVVFLVFITSLRDMGAGQYLVQERELTPEKVQAAWTVSLGTGCLAALIVVALATPVSRFYEEPRMLPIMMLIGLNFAINPFGSLTYAWLIREMRFEALATMRFLSALAGSGVSVGLAWKGHGPISLAYGSLATTLVNSLVGLFFRPSEFRLMPGRRGIREVLSKGSRFSASGLISAVGYGMAELILGKVESLATAALYSRANGLGSMFHKLVLDATQAVAVPMFARESREGGDVSESYLQGLSYVTALGWAFFLALALLAHPLIRLLYGLQWDDAVTATRLIAVAYMVGLPASLSPGLLLGLGKSGLLLRTTIKVTALHVLLPGLGAFIAGLEGVAVGAIASNLLACWIWLSATHQVTGFAWPALARALMSSWLVAMCASAGPTLAVLVFGLTPESMLAPLMVAGSVGAICFYLGVMAVRHPLEREFSRLNLSLRTR